MMTDARSRIVRIRNADSTRCAALVVDVVVLNGAE